MIGLPYGEKNCDRMLSRFHLIPQRYGQTDGRTDGQNCYINIWRAIIRQLLIVYNYRTLRHAIRKNWRHFRNAAFSFSGWTGLLKTCQGDNDGYSWKH